jgi:hypothetical protein
MSTKRFGIHNIAPSPRTDEDTFRDTDPADNTNKNKPNSSKIS